MELETIIERLSEKVISVEEYIPAQQERYIASIGATNEKTVVQHLVQEWSDSYPEELPGLILKDRRLGEEGCFEIPYPDKRQIKLDFGFSSSTSHPGADNLKNLEWVVEFKKINFVGDTGADFSERAVGKLTSPFPATGPILLDALRISRHSYGKRRAVILLSSDVLVSQLEVCREHPKRTRPYSKDEELDRYKVLKGTLKKNDSLNFNSVPLFPFIESIFDLNEINYSDCIHRTVTGLTKHPIFSRLTLAGWEINPQSV